MLWKSFARGLHLSWTGLDKNLQRWIQFPNIIADTVIFRYIHVIPHSHKLPLPGNLQPFFIPSIILCVVLLVCDLGCSSVYNEDVWPLVQATSRLQECIWFLSQFSLSFSGYPICHSLPELSRSLALSRPFLSILSWLSVASFSC